MNEAACWYRLAVAAMLAMVLAGCDRAVVDESIGSIQSTTFRDGESYCWDADGNDTACPGTMPTWPVARDDGRDRAGSFEGPPG